MGESKKKWLGVAAAGTAIAALVARLRARPGKSESPAASFDVRT